MGWAGTIQVSGVEVKAQLQYLVKSSTNLRLAR